MTTKRTGKVVNGIATFNDAVSTGGAQHKEEGMHRKVRNKPTVTGSIPIPDLWHVVERIGFDTEDGRAVLETWHLAHELRAAIVHIDRIIVSLREETED